MSNKLTPMTLRKVSESEIISFLQQKYQDQPELIARDCQKVLDLQHYFPFLSISELHEIVIHCETLSNNKVALNAIWSFIVYYHNSQYKYLQTIYPDIDLKYNTALNQNSKDAMNNYNGFKHFMDYFYNSMANFEIDPLRFDSKIESSKHGLFKLFLTKLKLLWIKLKTKVLM